MKTSFKRRQLYAGILTATTLLGTSLVNAESSLAIEEIVVTANKRAQNLQDVSVAVTAFTGDQIKELQLGQPVDLAHQTPGLDIKNAVGNTNPVITIRGIGLNDYNSNNSPSAAVHVDQAYIGSNAYLSFQMFDIKRVEVLKGPQGTLYGRNTTAGSVNFITNKPSEEFEAYVDTSYGNFNTFNLEAAVGGQLAEGMVGRFAVMTKQADGRFTNLGTVGTSAGTSIDPLIPVVPVVEENDEFGDTDAMAWRGSLAWESSDELDVLFTMHGSRDKSDNWVLKMADPDRRGVAPVGDEDTIYTDQEPTIDADQIGGALHINWDMEFATLTSITSYESLERIMGDSDASPYRIRQTVFDDDMWQATQELRLTSNGEEGLSWIVGAFYMEDEIDFSKVGDNLDFLGGNSDVAFLQASDSWALFGQTEYQLSDEFKLTIGLRYTEEEKTLVGRTLEQDPYGTSTLGARFTDLPIFADEQYETDDVSGKLGLDWTPNDDWLVYASVSKGFKSGGFDGSTILNTIELTPIEAETLWAYELGFKSSLADGALQLNGSFYYYDFEDMQVETLVDIAGGIQGSIRTNAGKAEVTGGELEAWWRPAEGLDLKFGVALIDSEIVEWNSLDLDEVEEIEGNSLSDAPEVTFNALVRYQWFIGDDLIMTASTDVNYSDTIYKDIANTAAQESDSFTLWNARLALGSEDGAWTAALWGKNLTDKRYVTHNISLFGPIAEMYNAPRTYGVSVRYNWR